MAYENLQSYTGATSTANSKAEGRLKIDAGQKKKKRLIIKEYLKNYKKNYK